MGYLSSTIPPARKSLLLAHGRGPKSSLMSEPDCPLDHLRGRHVFPGFTTALFIWVKCMQVCVAWRDWHVDVWNKDECRWV